jgi:hypothetical protein
MGLRTRGATSMLLFFRESHEVPGNGQFVPRNQNAPGNLFRIPRIGGNVPRNTDPVPENAKMVPGNS